MNTPWGQAQQIETIAPGITSVSTAGHGGIHLTPELNQIVPDYMRCQDGWYEEDCDWAVVALVFPDHFDTRKQQAAEKTLRDWDPDSWERFMGRKLKPGESMKRDEEVFYAEHQNDMLVISAQGDWADGVPKGFVRVTATRGGRRGGGISEIGVPEEAVFLVPESEYHIKRGFAFVIQPHHERVTALCV